MGNASARHAESAHHAEKRGPSDELTELVFVLDRSGSMCGLEADTVGGYNALLEKNRAFPGLANVSLVLFNDSAVIVHDRVDIREVRPLEASAFEPCGCTALLDAVGGAVRHTRMVQDNLPAAHRADHVLLAIATDGYENASHRYGYAQVKRMLEDARERLGWEVLFMGANIDVAAEAGRLGVDPGCAVSYEATPCGTAAAFDCLAAASARVRSGRRARQ